MKKPDLLKLIETIADDGDINETLLGNEEFKGLRDLSKLGADDINGILTGEVGKAYMTSHDDSIRSKAVETFKTGKMQEEIKKAVDAATNKEKTPEQKELEKLQKQFAESQAELTKERNTAKYSKVLKDKGLPSELVGFIYGDGTEEVVNKNIESIGKIINGTVDSKVNEKLGSSAYIPPAGGLSANALNAQIASAIGVK
ncbi:DUF4355 domain-containing protein [Clostridium botulinum]|uniref:DUF4355 domain-containing protein n=1 Tax=unclassified Clostridium TaxID=2614128 RepID=UPI0005408898|nr:MULTISPECIES: DUF4355 domain-containing protein [unclassified Clostridium]AIY81176.1 hypothetical protein U728_1666 [Clostridium botulinum 202F]KAI3345000.1 DUF4355 domain-containing protein [Clostridium botulinum]KON14086.1 hypothetical protein ACP50_04045 [Clostridium botulinum]MBY6986417.1 DUF4355 domain-containing protein [Clostridium botulinum]MBY7009061.1 DUF4355 domain-containing protein [Clostridium botulinum]